MKSGGGGYLIEVYRIATAFVRDNEIVLPNGFSARDLTNTIKELGERWGPKNARIAARCDCYLIPLFRLKIRGFTSNRVFEAALLRHSYDRVSVYIRHPVAWLKQR